MPRFHDRAPFPWFDMLVFEIKNSIQPGVSKPEVSLQIFKHDRRCECAYCIHHIATNGMQSRLKATIYVSGLDNAVNNQILIDAFLPFGDVVEVTLPKPEVPSSNDSHRGFGYVEFETPADAKEAIENMDQSELFGRVIKVAPSKPQKSSTDGLGSKQAIWEQARFNNLLLNRVALIITIGRLSGEAWGQRGGQNCYWKRDSSIWRGPRDRTVRARKF